MISKFKIALIIPYFGKFKNYFPLFLMSCKNNPTINWLVFTDSNDNYEWPQNVKCIKMSFWDFRDIVQQNFEFSISLDSPYKLCDYKPAYGEILQDYLKEYDFWGHCDCDMIFGDIREFISDDTLLHYTKIFSRGHLTIYKNDEDTNSFYRTQKEIDYKKVYTSLQSYSFDEWPGLSKVWERLGKGFYDEMPFDDIIVNLTGFFPTKKIGKKEIGGPYHLHNIDLSKKYKVMKNIIYKYIDGKLYRIWCSNKNIYQEEVLYVHLQKRDMKIQNIAILMEKESFFVCPGVFMEINGDLSKDFLKAVSPAYLLNDIKTIAIQELLNIIHRFRNRNNK